MLKNKWVKIAQTAVKTSFDVGYLDLIVFIDLGSRFFLNFGHQKQRLDATLIRLFSSFSYINRYAGKRSMSWFASHQGLPNLRIWAEFIFFGGCRDVFHHWGRSLLIFKRYTISYCANMMTVSFCFFAENFQERKLLIAKPLKLVG